MPAAFTACVVMPREGNAVAGPGDLSTIKISASSSAGQLLVREYRFDPGVGPPLHQHTNEDEIFWVLEGTVTFMLDGVRSEVGAGACILAPRGKPHAFKNTGNTPARLIAMDIPGENFENFLNEMTALASEPSNLDDKSSSAAEISRLHGIEILGRNTISAP